jgi:glucose-6-phosphate isomerase
MGFGIFLAIIFDMENKLYFKTQNIRDITKAIDAEREHIGFYDLPLADPQAYLDYAAQSDCSEVVVIGIGGSALGASAIYKFTKSVRTLDKKLHVLDTTDPLVLQRRLDKVNKDKALFIVISKSGTTIETVSILKYITTLVPINPEQYLIITDEGSKLEDFAEYHKLTHFTIPSDVGGRFSVLSAVGLLPLALVGVDIASLLKGARTVRDSFFGNDGYCSLLLEKATYYAQHANTYNINCLFSYSESFREFNAWYVQLWGESLGKKQLASELHVGLTPVGLIGPTDQHSFLQLIVEGKRDKSVTVIKVKKFRNAKKVPDVSLKHLESMDLVNELTFSKLINMQADSIIESLDQLGDIPLDVIEIDNINEEAMGQLIYYYELLTAMVAKMLGINAYDQPGVEMGKKILKEKLA